MSRFQEPERISLYQTIKEAIIEQLRSGQLKEQDRIPSEKELMDSFSVSRITVSRALTELAKEGYITRIPGRGSFVSLVPPAKKAVAEDATGTPGVLDSQAAKPLIGFIIQSIGDEFATRLLNGVIDAVEKLGGSLIIKSSLNQANERHAIREFEQFGVRGMIILPVDQEHYNDEILSMKMRHFPLVLVDRYLPGVETHLVSSDGFKGGFMGTEYLLGLGHQRIAFCTSTRLPTTSTDSRLRGYMEAVKQHGNLIDPALIVTDLSSTDDLLQSNNKLITILKERRATAFFTAESMLAAYIHRQCISMNIRVPEEVSILSYDDPMLECSEFSFFSHISQSEYQMGYRAAEMLMSILDKPASPTGSGYQKEIIPPELVLRKSTGPCAQPLPKGKKGSLPV